MKKLYNQKSKDLLVKKLESEDFERITCSFYKYVTIVDPLTFRDRVYKEFDNLEILGRVYISKEGINAQISVPDKNWDLFVRVINGIKPINEVDIKTAINDGTSFYKLIVKVKKEIVAYNIPKNKFDMNVVGDHLNTKQFNEAMENSDTTVIDMRNIYESEVGKFISAEVPQVEKSKDLLPEVRRMLKGREHHQILLYCTGGIRCEKASSYLINEGIKNVKQLQGGIIQYAHDIKKEALESKFIGKNFVFDARLGERVTEDIISTCHLCGDKSDNHKDCKNDACHILFIQCSKCDEKLNGCCSNKCKKIASLPIDEQIKYRKNQKFVDKRRYFKSARF